MKKQVKKELLWLCGLSALALFATKRKRAAILPLAIGGVLALQKTKNEIFVGQSVAITGGSRGLGLALAKELLQTGALVTLLARDPEELARAKEMLAQIPSGEVHTIICDVTDPEQLKKAIDEAALQFGGIDLLINNAGAITVGPFESMDAEDFEAQMKLHVYAPINAIKFALPHLRKEESGKRIVNICSMGGRVAVPHMLPYDTSKFALSGFSQGVAAELAPEGISVTTIYPTVMRTGSPIQAVFKGDHEREFAWFQSGDVMPFFSLSAQSAAKKIIAAALDRRWELVPSFFGQLRCVVAAVFPELLGEIMIFMGARMPKGQSKEYRTGAQSRKLFDDSRIGKILNKRAHEPEKELNQEPKIDARYNMNLH